MDITDPYSRAADQIVIFHFGLVASIIIYQLALPIGIYLRSWWARNFWIRALHLGIMAFIGVEGAIGMECPLTIWERGLRIAEMDDETRSRYFAWEHNPMESRPKLAQFSHNMLLYRLEEGNFSWLGVSNSTFFHGIHMVFGILVILTWVLGPPEPPSFLSKTRVRQTIHLEGNNP